jgi:hypothetical protein
MTMMITTMLILLVVLNKTNTEAVIRRRGAGRVNMLSLTRDMVQVQLRAQERDGALGPAGQGAQRLLDHRPDVLIR